MLEKDFFLNDKKKILISDSFANADELIKRFVLENKTAISNIEVITIKSLCESLYKRYGNQNYKIIEDIDGHFIVDYLLRNNRYSFIPAECFSISTAKVFYQAIQEIKFGHIKNNKNPRYLEILPLLDDYDNYLTENLYLDPADLIKVSIKYINEESLLFGNDVLIGITNNIYGKLRYIEQEFVDKICRICGVFDINCIDLIKQKETKKVKVDAHGFINEIQYIVKDVIKHGYCYNDIDIFVSDNSYTQTIMSLFDTHDIPYSFNDGVSSSFSSFISVMRNCLNFLYYLCDVKYIYAILNCDVIKDEFKPLIEHLPNLKCDHLNIASYNGKPSSPLEENLKAFLEFLVSLDDDLDISTLFSRLIAFMEFACKEEAYNAFSEPLQKIVQHLAFVQPISCFSKERKIIILNSFLDTIVNTTSINDSIRIKPLSKSYLLTRKHNYFVGLSASQMIVKEIQSPVLNDDELLNVLDDHYYIGLAKNNNSNLLADVYRLINSGLNNSYLTFIYSSYDSLNFKAQAQSTLYTDIEAKEVKADYPLDIGALKKEEISLNKHEEIKSFTFSASALSSFLDCPYRYLLKNSEGYQEISIPQYSNNWLVGGEYGTFCHRVLQQYFNINNTKEKQKIFDQKVLDLCLNEVKQETYKDKPFSNDDAVNIAIKTAKRDLINYLNYYFYNNDGYVTVACEYNFSNDGVSETFVIDDTNVILKYEGVIDRIDVKVDDEGHFYVKTIDYKTSSSSSINSIAKKGKAFQAHIYTLAAKAFCLKYKNKIERLLNKKLDYEKDEDITNISFDYVLIKEKPLKMVVPVTLEQDAGAQDTLKKIIKSIMGFNENHDLFNILEILDKDIGVAGEHGSNSCSYCSFAKHCLYKVKYGEKCILVDKKEEKGDGNNN